MMQISSHGSKSVIFPIVGLLILFCGIFCGGIYELKVMQLNRWNKELVSYEKKLAVTNENEILGKKGGVCYEVY